MLDNTVVPGIREGGRKTSFGQRGPKSYEDPVSELFKFSLDLLMCSPSMKFTKWCAKKYLEANPDAVEEWLKEEGIEASEKEMMEKYGYLKKIGTGTDILKDDADGSVRSSCGDAEMLRRAMLMWMLARPGPLKNH